MIEYSQAKTGEYPRLLNSHPRMMQFWLSDWFTVHVSRLPAIIPTCDLIWKLMRQMSNFLCEAKFRRQKNG